MRREICRLGARLPVIYKITIICTEHDVTVSAKKLTAKQLPVHDTSISPAGLICGPSEIRTTQWNVKDPEKAGASFKWVSIGYKKLFSSVVGAAVGTSDI